MSGTPSADRPVRHSREEIRRMMMAAGEDILREQGLGVATGAPTFKQVFDRVESTAGVRLTNASVIRRVWENQAEFQDDVLNGLALAGDAGGETGDTVGALAPLLSTADLSSPAARVRALSEVCRIGGEASLRALTGSRNWSVWVGIWVLGVTGPSSERGRRLRRALLDGYESTTDLWVELHGALATHLGFRVRAPFTLRQFTVSVGALVEGCALRQGTEGDRSTVLRPSGADGELQEWSLFGVGLEALAHQYLELDPDWTGPRPGS